ncbi:hypothetical protein LRP52_35980 [Photobacterium sp. ZSDE20]|uniref:Uncharacterized protein n=1 Tax=Photobacterium pectinilyticum TaxID=2906793 RepID=A0ABT1NA05_9GAMM|nr:hypothetical protein [Photobacterium sp. ZSDE20]MCQ1060129.1 hypothetical protein [Photobacterium sp. ZSDE20]MDD1827585.1 hypothetical protein [Photobacterium sp. ZSDE20]
MPTEDKEQLGCAVCGTFTHEQYPLPLLHKIEDNGYLCRDCAGEQD